MADITMCDGVDHESKFICPKRDTCYRYTAPVNQHWQAYFSLLPYKEDTCEAYWDNKDR